MPRLLDLFCGVGGAGMGYHLAGFEVTGVDKLRQPKYPFAFIRADVRDFLASADLSGFDAIHASPPCQRYSPITQVASAPNGHPDLIGWIRDRFAQLGIPWVIENVVGSPLDSPVLVCGTALGLAVDGYRLRRHRLFEASFPVVGTGCACANDPRPCMDVTGNGGNVSTTRVRTKHHRGGRSYKGTADQRRQIMEMPWAARKALAQAVPPAYTQHIGQQLYAAVERVGFSR